MKTISLKGNGQIREGRTELDVPHLGETLTFVLPLNGPNYQDNVMNGISNQGLARPTTARTFSLIDLAMQNSDESHCREILERFRNHYLWTSTESILFSEGVIVYDNANGDMPQTSLELIKLAEARDKRVRFIEKGFRTGDMSISEFLRNPYTIAQVGEDILETVERVAKQVNKKTSRVHSLDSSNPDVKRYTAVSGCKVRLGLDGGYGGYDRAGYASGVLKTGEASRTKSKTPKK